MELVKSIIILVIGFALLMKGADYFVEGSSSVAKRLYMSQMCECLGHFLYKLESIQKVQKE